MEYPGWKIYLRLLIDDYPLVVLAKDNELRFISEGYYQNIIEFLLPLAEPGEDFVFESGSTRVESIHNQLHQAFVSGQEFGNGVIYFQLRSILGHDVAIEGAEFQQEIERYQQRTGYPPTEPFWYVSPNFAGWDGCGHYIPQSSINKIIQVTQQIKAGELNFPLCVQLFSEDEWDLRFGWAEVTGFVPSVLRKLETIAADYMQFFANQGHLYQPNLVEPCRTKLLQELDAVGLLNCEIPESVYSQLMGTYPHLRRCVDEAEFLWMVGDMPIQEFDLSLDWMVFDPLYPVGIMDDVEFRDTPLESLRERALATFRTAQLEQPETLRMEIHGNQYQLITGWEGGRIKLLNSIELIS
ncbi:hypothetical protein NIES37_67180 [Tolypothrix tenuis PCC 7101]|uniref:Uncharacterized protein n=1 Tax=Tolypothrix tenuis PCC 7101 TaxID=231146 RepID=A0A1Z4NAK7_9CYAN|nr:hypothetical protein [Aulosira sp. FACHB-113]BAY35636.1 hypothetical protein NIES2107_75480 [Nostoc carneum NIES-2107]BAZ02705.1 hypothetical protein NIES37_67180 [Tolypothrix tenuis PCC 7101]BAZ78402.1 hypothetical protein NIES50_70350 [Aulosira laxa NIES-50]